MSEPRHFEEKGSNPAEITYEEEDITFGPRYRTSDLKFSSNIRADAEGSISAHGPDEPNISNMPGGPDEADDLEELGRPGIVDGLGITQSPAGAASDREGGPAESSAAVHNAQQGEEKDFKGPNEEVIARNAYAYGDDYLESSIELHDRRDRLSRIRGDLQRSKSQYDSLKREQNEETAIVPFPSDRTEKSNGKQPVLDDDIPIDARDWLPLSNIKPIRRFSMIDESEFDRPGQIMTIDSSTAPKSTEQRSSDRRSDEAAVDPRDYSKNIQFSNNPLAHVLRLFRWCSWRKPSKDGDLESGIGSSHVGLFKSSELKLDISTEVWQFCVEEKLKRRWHLNQTEEEEKKTEISTLFSILGLLQRQVSTTEGQSGTLDATASHTSAPHSSAVPLVREALQRLYNDSILEEPAKGDEKGLRKQVDMLASVLSCCNIWTSTSLVVRVDDPSRAEFITVLEDPITAIIEFDPPNASSFQSSLLTRSPRQHRMFDVDDLDIHTLQDIGDLKIEWTDQIGDHLLIETGGAVDDNASSASGAGSDEIDSVPYYRNKRLETEHSGHTLYLYWSDTIRLSWLSMLFLERDMDEAARNAEFRSLEILRTWSFLFQPRRRQANRRARAAYEDLPVPDILGRFLLARQPPLARKHFGTMGDLIDENLQEQVHDVKQHLSGNLQQYNASKNGQYSYKLFPKYGSRIAILKYYMSKKKPRSFRQLWRDKRDTLGYYTFWAVIIFGIVSILLASLSLVASVVQAWASVKALKQVSKN